MVLCHGGRLHHLQVNVAILLDRLNTSPTSFPLRLTLKSVEKSSMRCFFSCLATEVHRFHIMDSSIYPVFSTVFFFSLVVLFHSKLKYSFRSYKFSFKRSFHSYKFSLKLTTLARNFSIFRSHSNKPKFLFCL